MEDRTRTIVGAAALIIGEIQSDDDVSVDGTLDGPITTARSLDVGANGEVRGDVSARDVHLFGLIDGNVSALGILEIEPTGRVLGDIRAGGLRIHDGGTFHGKVEIVEDPAAASAAATDGPVPPSDPAAETMVSPPPVEFDPAAVTVMRAPPGDASTTLPSPPRRRVEEDDDPPPEWDSQELLQAERKAAIQSAIEHHERKRPRPGAPRERSLRDMFTETGRVPPIEDPDEQPPARPLDEITVESGAPDET